MMQYVFSNIFLSSVYSIVSIAVFISQAYRMIQQKSAHGVSLGGFCGLWLLQMLVFVYAIHIHHTVFIYGSMFAAIFCLLNIVLIINYHRTTDMPHINNIELINIINQLPVHIYCKDKNGVCLFSNKKNWQNLGLKSLKDFIGKTDYDLMSQEEADRLLLIDQAVMRTENHFIGEEPLTSPDGNKSIFLTNKACLRDARGNIIGIVGCSVDVTEEKQHAFNKLKMYEDIIDAMPANVYWLDRSGKYLGCNKSQLDICGSKSGTDIIGKSNIELAANDDITYKIFPSIIDPINDQVMRDNTTIVLKEPASLKDGTEITVLSSKSPLTDINNKVIGMVGVSIDISDKKQMEQQLQNAMKKAEAATVAKTEFMNNMRHDLRTPFCGILNVAELLSSQEIDSEKKTMLGYIISSSKQLLNHLNDILEMTVSETGSLPILEKNVHIKDLVHEIIDILVPAAKAKGICLLHDIDKSVPQSILSDQVRIQRILLNLVSNAIKFTSVGSVQVNVFARLLEKREVSLIITVKDTGIGIPKDKQDQIYEKFNRLTPSHIGVYGGKGLGLSIVKLFLDDIDGEIHLDSAPGKGSCFTIIIPCKVPLRQVKENILV